MACRVGEDVRPGELGCTQREHRRDRRVDVLDHDVEVDLLRYATVRPGRSFVIRGELEGKPGGGVVGCDYDPVVAVIGDRLVQQFRIEGCEPARVRTVQHDMMQPTDHGRDSGTAPLRRHGRVSGRRGIWWAP
jgi:hypothetical protein